MKKVTLEPLGESALVATGAPVLSALLAKDLRVLMSCGGKGICSTCHVRVCDGADQLSPVGPKERRTLALVADATPESRLACQAAVYGDGVTVAVPAGMYIEKAEDLLAMLGTRAPENILHPVNGAVLIPKGKLITRTLLEQSRSVEQDVRHLKGGDSKAGGGPLPGDGRPAFTASGIAPRRAPSAQTTHSVARASVETKSTPGAGRPPATDSPKPPAKAAPSPAPRGADVCTSRTDVSPLHRASVGTSVVPVVPVAAAAAAPPAVAVHAGAQVGKYLLLEQVGKGGAGVVYRALHTTLKSLVAVKFLRADLDDGGGRERLAREAQLLAQLSHPNVVRVLDYEDDPARPYVVMEFVDGLTAADLVAQSGRLAPGRAVEVALDVAAGLSAAHALGIVHRDVKPGNVLVARSGGSKLVDLGLATLARPNPTGGSPGDGAVEGTVGYMSPEALTAAPTDHRSDIYSLGATLFHLAAGRLPFVGGSLTAVMMKHLHQPPPVLHELVAEAPPQLSAVIQTMMAKAPGQRYQTYADLCAELKLVRHACGGH